MTKGLAIWEDDSTVAQIGAAFVFAGIVGISITYL